VVAVTGLADLAVLTAVAAWLSIEGPAATGVATSTGWGHLDVQVHAIHGFTPTSVVVRGPSL
jgi:hypothetical protein